jgi:hypothetical protein
MRTLILKRARRAFGQAHPIPQSRGVIVMVALLLAAVSLFASPTVNTLGGGNPNVKPKYLGYKDGITLNQALFHTPCGLALDYSGQYLFVADRDNNVIRYLDLVAGYTWTFDITATNLLNKPVAVAVDIDDNVYVLNRGNGTNGSVVTFDNWGDAVAINAVRLTNAAGMALDSGGNIYLTVQSNKLIRIDAGTTNRTTIATNFPAGTSLQGIVVKHNGLIATCDSGRNGIYLINPVTRVVTTNAGFHGAGDFTTNGNNIASSATAKFNHPMCVAEAGDGTLIVTDYGNNRVKAVLTSGVVTNLYGVTSKYWGGTYPGWYDGTVFVPDSIAPNVQSHLPFGVVLASDGSFYTTEDYYHIIRHVTGAGLQPQPPPPPPLPAAPTILTVITNYGEVALTWTTVANATNYNVKRSLISGGPYNIISSPSSTSFTDTNVINGTNYYYVVSAVNTGGEGPNSAEVSATPLPPPAPTIVTVVANYSSPMYGTVSLTWSTIQGAISYKVKRSTSTNESSFTTIISTPSTSYTDTKALNGSTYYYMVSAVNPGGEGANSAEVSATPPYPPVTDPQIGYVDFPVTAIGSVFHPVSSFTFNNDTPIIIVGEAGSQTYYVAASTPSGTNTIPDPTSSDTSAQSGYEDGLDATQVGFYSINQILPDLTVKAIGEETNHPNSAVVQARFLYVVGNPQIIGGNAGLFTLNDITANCTFWYSVDGVDPTNSPGTTNYDHSIFLGTNSVTLTNQFSLPISSNFLFKVCAFKNNYQPSAVVSAYFSATNFVPDSISFGFASGEASSDFIASPGQTFYAPVTLSVLPSTVIDSLQFNLTVNSGGPNPGPAITPGAFGFESLLEEPIPNTTPVVYEYIPPLMFAAYATNPPPASAITNFNGLPFVSLESTNLALNRLAVGWLERFGETNLYNTLGQDLITYSQAHDTLYPSSQHSGQIEVGAYVFAIPTNAAPNQTYQIQIGRPSATSDGIGAPGSAVFIYAPTNGSFTNGAINSIKNVTIGQLKYIAGDVYPFRWFNAGDFGAGNLVTYGAEDVAQVFQSAVYGLNSPSLQAPGSDFFDAMDSCGATYNDNGHGYLELGNMVNDPAALNALFDGNDTTIDSIAFGDGKLDVCDVYVTFIRSEFSNHVCFQRFWTNGVRVAQIVPNPDIPNSAIVSSVVSKLASGVSSKDQQSGNSATNQAGNISITNQPKVNFTAGDCQTNAGSTIQIPITANIFGSHPLRVLMLNLSVVPLDGSPALTTPVQFTQNPVLGSPYFATPYSSTGKGDYANVWLNSGISGLSNNVSIGTLTVTIPTNATSSSAYAVHFDHVSASPNGIASFPKQARTGLITLSNRSGSSWGDGIPDSWRLRYFLTLNNLLSATNADADGDGMNNLQEYLAGTDPTDPTSCFKNIGTDPSAAQQPSDCVISWPSVIGKQYVIDRSSSLSTPIWTAVGTNSGNGTIMEYHDSSGGGIRFYRVQVQ